MKQLDICKKCSSVLECMAIIIDHLEIEVKCIHFGCLKKYLHSIELPNVIDEFNNYGCTSFAFTIEQLEQENTK